MVGGSALGWRRVQKDSSVQLSAPVPDSISLTVSDDKLQEDSARREDRAHRSLDYDSHMGVERDPISREIVNTATHT